MILFGRGRLYFNHHSNTLGQTCFHLWEVVFIFLPLRFKNEKKEKFSSFEEKLFPKLSFDRFDELILETNNF